MFILGSILGSSTKPLKQDRETFDRGENKDNTESTSKDLESFLKH